MKKTIFITLMVIAAVNFLIGFNVKSDHMDFSLQKAEAAWFEFGEASKKLEYATNETPCSVYAYVQFQYGAEIGVSLEPPSITIGSNIHVEYKLVAGKRLNCIDGKIFRDCEDALGSMWNSISGHGDCVPNS